jgi:hypothetical protein
MNRKIVFTVAAALAVAGTAYAQNQEPPAPGAQATPGTTNPSTSDPSTATPSTVSPPARSAPRSATPPSQDSANSQDTTSPSSASGPHQRQATGQENTPEANTANGANPSAASSPHQREATGTDRSNPKADQDMSTAGKTRMAAASPSGDVSAGTKVHSPAGTPIGTVKDIVPKANGAPGYVLITMPSGNNTAVPYATIAPMIQNGAIVLDSSKLQGAPTVTARELQDPSNTRWKQQADDYWNGQGSPH